MLIELLLPNGNIRKYARMIIGMYIMYILISPLIVNKKIKFNENILLDLYKKYENDANLTNQNIQDYSNLANTKANNIINNQKEYIKNTYISKVKNDINQKLNSLSYKCNNLNIKLSNNDDYSLERIELQLIKIKNDKDSRDSNKCSSASNEIKMNSIKISSVNEICIDNDINVNNEQKQQNNKKENNMNTEFSNLSDSEKQNVREKLAIEYMIDTNNVVIY